MIKKTQNIKIAQTMNKPTKTPGLNISSLYGSMLPESAQTLLQRTDLHYTIRHDNLIIYKGAHAQQHGKKRDPLATNNLNKRKYNGELSKNAVKHISKQVSLWADCIDNYNRYYNRSLRDQKRKMVFATLTLPSPQLHTDQEIKRKILVPFLDTMKYNLNTNNYFWRAEAQENNNIHFHIIFDTYINKKTLQNKWNQTLEKLGYITQFEIKHGHRNPPTTHIKLVDNTKNTIKYVLKYATKDSTNRNITGKIWGMSTSIRCLKVPTFIYSGNIINDLLKALYNKEVTFYEQEHFISFKYKKPIYQTHSRSEISKTYRHKLFQIYSYLYYSDQPFNDDQTMIIYDGLIYEEIKSITKTV
jgi:hypothetical protein